MTTSNPITAVEALAEAVRLTLDSVTEHGYGTLDCHLILHADAYHALERTLQALQLHGGGESRSDFASGSGDKVRDATIAVEAIAALAACVGSFALMGGKSPGRRLGHMASSIRAAYVCSSEALEDLQSKLSVQQALSSGGE